MPAVRIWTGSAWQDLATAGAAQGTMEPWHTVGAAGEPNFLNNWVNYEAPGGNNAQVGFRKFPDGRVRLRGLMKNGTTGNSVQFLTMPAGYRPAAFVRFTVPAMGAANPPVTATVEISSAGLVYVNTTVNGYVDLGSIEFDTETVTSYAVGPQGIPGSRPSVTQVASTGSTGALGGAWQDVPGMQTAGIALKAGQVVLLDGSIYFSAASVVASSYAFVQIWNGSAWSQPAGALGYVNQYSSNAAINGYFVVPADGTYQFKVSATSASGSGAQAGGGGNVSFLRVTAFS